MASGRRALAGVVWTAVLALATAGSVRAAQKEKTPPPQVAAAQAQAEQVQALVHIADTAMTGQSVPSDFPIAFHNDFIRAQGARVWVPITLTLDPAKLSKPADDPLMVYLRVAPAGTKTPPAVPAKDTGKGKSDKKKKGDKPAPPPESAYPVEDVSVLDAQPEAAGQPVRIMRGFSVPAGKYDLYVVVQERGAAAAAPKTAMLKQPLDVPDYTTAFSTSSVIIADGTRQLAVPITPDQQAEHPYSFGSTEILVSADHAFRKSQELVVILQIYNPTIADKKFNLEATYTFFKESPAGETRFNATEPQVFTPETVGAAFDPTAPDHSIQAGQGVPLQSFAEGPYRLEITVTDKGASPAKVLTQSVHFTVSS